MHIKFFIGIRLTPDLKIALSHLDETPLALIPHESREYLGLYVNEPTPTLRHLHTQLTQLHHHLKHALPDVRTDHLATLVFPLLMIG